MPSSPADYIPQTVTDRRSFVIWAVVATVSLIVMGMITGAPLAQASGHNVFAFALYGAFSHLCHQISERSFFIGGHQFAVCARCTGLYAGFAIATLCYPLFRSLRRTDTPARLWLFLAAVPLAIDFLLGFFGIWENTHLSRFLTGALLGSVAVFYVVPGLIDFRIRELRQLLSRKPVVIKS
jgi:uncharacterized membrane protein